MIRTAKREDETALRRIWQEAFEDTKEYEDLAWSRFDNMSRITVVTNEENEPVSLACLYENGTLHIDGEEKRCPCIYGVGTRLDSRGHGYAMQAIEELLDWCRKQQIEYVMISPAEESLFRLYERKFGFRPFFYIAEVHADFTDSPVDSIEHTTVENGAAKIRFISATEYSARREGYLVEYTKNHPYLSMTKEQLEYEQQLLQLVGGSFFEYRENETVFYGAYEEEDNEVCMMELLTEACDYTQLAEKLSRAFPNKRITARMPVWAVMDAEQCADVTIRPYSMLLCLNEEKKVAGDKTAYAGFIFD